MTKTTIITATIIATSPTTNTAATNTTTICGDSGAPEEGLCEKPRSLSSPKDEKYH